MKKIPIWTHGAKNSNMVEKYPNNVGRHVWGSCRCTCTHWQRRVVSTKIQLSGNYALGSTQNKDLQYIYLATSIFWHWATVILISVMYVYMYLVELPLLPSVWDDWTCSWGQHFVRSMGNVLSLCCKWTVNPVPWWNRPARKITAWITARHSLFASGSPSQNFLLPNCDGKLR